MTNGRHKVAEVESLEDRCWECQRSVCEDSYGGKHTLVRVLVSHDESLAVCAEGHERIICRHPFAANCGEFWAQRALVECV